MNQKYSNGPSIVSAVSDSIGVKPVLNRTCEECINQPLVPGKVGDDQTIFAFVHALNIKRLTRFDLVLITKVDRYDDLAFR